MTRQPLDVLRDVFGHDDFRGRQREVVSQVVAGGDAVVLFPTGAGKSICYQVPALCRPGTGDRGLAADRPDARPGRGLAAGRRQRRGAELRRSSRTKPAASGATSLSGDAEAALRRARAARRRRFPGLPRHANRSRCSPSTRPIASRQWGHDFRPEYLQLGQLARTLPRRAPHRAHRHRRPADARRSAPARLGLDDAPVFATSFDRPNIRYTIVEQGGAARASCSASSTGHADASGIVYCLSRKKVEETAEALLSATASGRCPTTPGLDRDVRDANQDAFLKEDKPLPRRDRGVRHGHRQAGRALRGPSRPARVRRGLLPGDRPGRTRRPACRRLDDLRA